MINLRRTSQGYISVLVLMIMGFVGIALAVCFSQSSTRINIIKTARVLSARDALISHIRSYASMGASLRASMHPGLLPATINQELKDCILGGASPCESGIEKPLSLYYPISPTNPASNTGLFAVSGTNAQPVYYDERGAICTETTRCPFFSASTTFIPTCAAGAPTCATADSIVVHFKINSNVYSASTIPIASVDERAASVARSSIFPDPISSASANIPVLLLPGSSPDTLTADQIRNALIVGGLTNSTLLDGIVPVIQTSGITSLAVITAIGDPGQWLNLPALANVVNSMAAWNVTDPVMAKFLTEAVIQEPRFVKMILDSGIPTTKPYLVQYLLHEHIPDATTLAAVYAAVDPLPPDELTAAIGGGTTPVTDTTLAWSIRNLIPTTLNVVIGAGIIRSGARDAATVNTIAGAVAGVPNNRVAGAMAGWGITNPALANQLWTILSGIASQNQYDAEWIIRAVGIDPVAVQNAVNQYNGGVFVAAAPTVTAPTTTTPSSGSTTGPITLIEDCTSCQPLTF
jgi:hypothetical protein